MLRTSRNLCVVFLALVLVSPVFAAGADERYIVKFKNGAGRAAAAAVGQQVLDLPQINAAAFRLPAAAVEGLRNNPNVEYVEVDAKRYMMAQSTPWGITAVQADALNDGPGVRTVCIIDSGYSINHEDLKSTGVSGYNGNLAWDQDGCFHGSHVAGTVSAVDNTLGVVGVADPNLYIVRVFGNDCAWAYSSTLVDAAYRCEAGGANIISMSLGGSFSSSAEDAAFQDLLDNYDILSIAAAGNGGNKRKSYPASYNSVMSVAAVDSALNIASFSQENSQVEISGPGVTVRSTVGMGSGTDESATVNGVGYEVVAMSESGLGTGTGTLVDCGLGASACPGGGGQVCLIERGTYSFEEKTQACVDGGGVAAIIYNNAPGLYSGTLTNPGAIPSVGMSQADGQDLQANSLGTSASVTVNVGNYAFYDGTSMATPHVSGVAALIWSHDTSVDADCVRAAMDNTALDLGAAGRDNNYGFGLVQAVDALNYITAGNCGGGGQCGAVGESCNDGTDCCSGSCSGGKPGTRVCL